MEECLSYKEDAVGSIPSRATMSKIIALGDIHGHDSWKKIVEQEFDKLIFIGDYWDSFGQPFELQLKNFVELMKLKEKLGNKMVTLIGNHDFSYWKDGEPCSGYQGLNAATIRHALTMHKEKFKIAHREGDILFTHAGVSQTWFDNAFKENKALQVEDTINQAFEKNIESFYFNGWNMYGDDITQGPLWIRPRSLRKDKINGFIQVVGHTHFDEVRFENNIWFIDALPNQYLVIEDGVFTKKEL